MKRNLNIKQPMRARRGLGAACLSLLLATLPISSNALAQSTAPAAGTPPPSTSYKVNTSCSFSSPDLGDNVCATGEVVLLAPFVVALGVPMLVIWGGLALAMQPFAPAGGRNPLD